MSIPRPTTGIGLAPAAHHGKHLAHRSIETDQNRAGDDRMPDVQLVDLRNPRDWLHVVVVQAMPGGDPHSQLCRGLRRIHDPRELLLSRSPPALIAVTPGVQFNSIRIALI